MKILLFTILALFAPISSIAQTYKYIRLANTKYVLGKTFGDELNDYLKEGYVVKTMSATNDGYRHYLCTILSNDNQDAAIESYVYVEFNGATDTYYLSGDIPSGMNKELGYYKTNDFLQQLSNNGFQIVCFDIDGHNEFFLFAKKKSGGGTFVRDVTSDTENAIEMARYNMKGLPVDKNYKGTQIIVYSDYTTKVLNVK